MIICLLVGSCERSTTDDEVNKANEADEKDEEIDESNATREVDEITLSVLDQILESDIENDEVVNIIGREVIFDNVETEEDVLRNVEIIWIEIYGEELIKSERPYNISFDTDRNLWFVAGSFNYGDHAVGGVAFAVVSKESGKLLDVGHFE